MRPEVRKAGATAARALVDAVAASFCYGLGAAAFLAPVAVVALVVRWLW